MFLDQKIRGCASWDHGAEFVTVSHAAGVQFDDLAHRGAHGEFPNTWSFYPAAGSIELGAAVLGVRIAQAAEPFGSAGQDMRNAAEGFDVLNHGRLSPKAHDGRKRRLGPGDGPLALQRVEQRGFLT